MANSHFPLFLVELIPFSFRRALLKHLYFNIVISISFPFTFYLSSFVAVDFFVFSDHLA